MHNSQSAGQYGEGLVVLEHRFFEIKYHDTQCSCYEGSGFRKNIIKLQEPYRGKTVLAYLYKDSVGDLPEIGHKWEN